MSDREIVNRLIANDERMISEFFFVHCRGTLTYIGKYYFKEQQFEPEELIGDFYEYLSADDWHKLKIFKFTCSLNSYITIIASRYFQRKHDRDDMTLDEGIRFNDGDILSADSSVFVMEDVNKIMKNMPPLDKFLLQRILIDGEKPGNILLEAKEFMEHEGTFNTAATNDKQFAGYVYTRYNRAKKNVMKQMEMLGYGK